uniref:Uncharacterized protein n=1 Tax=Cacopsylla melanoneura TaxID=428564 RepID=A0A8D8ZCK9_9HEMI
MDKALYFSIYVILSWYMDHIVHVPGCITLCTYINRTKSTLYEMSEYIYCRSLKVGCVEIAEGRIRTWQHQSVHNIHRKNMSWTDGIFIISGKGPQCSLKRIPTRVSPVLMRVMIGSILSSTLSLGFPLCLTSGSPPPLLSLEISMRIAGIACSSSDLFIARCNNNNAILSS